VSPWLQVESALGLSTVGGIEVVPLEAPPAAGAPPLVALPPVVALVPLLPEAPPTLAPSVVSAPDACPPLVVVPPLVPPLPPIEVTPSVTTCPPDERPSEVDSDDPRPPFECAPPPGPARLPQAPLPPTAEGDAGLFELLHPTTQERLAETRTHRVSACSRICCSIRVIWLPVLHSSGWA
jgi:hypothetical protein